MKIQNKLKSLFVIAGLAMSLGLSANNITIFDGNTSGSPTGWYGIQENQETEPGTVTSQLWDMERFDLVGNTLSMTGGYNFTTPAGYDGWKPGHLFFDINGVGGNGTYDLVATINGTGTYNVYTLGTTYNVYYAVTSPSNPWRYKDGGTLLYSGLPVTYSNYSDVEGVHYVMNVDISWLTPYQIGDTVVHYTMECGNDNLMGKFATNVSDGGSTLAASLFGCMGLFLLRRKQ